MTNRRTFIWLTTGGVIAAAGLGAGLTAFPIGLADPAAAWKNPGSGETDLRRKALSYAILAPNPHNMQPWIADISTPDVIVLRLDRARLLPSTDPFGRQILIGCGAFLELLEMALTAFGAHAETTLFPDGPYGESLDSRPFARVALRPAPTEQPPLFAHVLQRRTSRTPYDLAKRPQESDLQPIAAAGSIDDLVTAAFTVDPSKASRLGDVAWRGFEREAATPDAHLESVNVMRIGDAAIAQHRDGISLGGAMMNLLAAAGVMTPEALKNPNSEVSRQGKAMWKALIDATPAFIWQRTADNARTTQIATGRAYLRLNLAATAAGLSVQPWSMALQEYPAMADIYAEQQAILNATAQAPIQMLARIGYAGVTPASPRRGLPALLQES